MSCVDRQAISRPFLKASRPATEGEKGLTVIAAPNEYLVLVMRRSGVAVGQCAGRQDLGRKRETSYFSAGSLLPRFEILFDFFVMVSSILSLS